MRTEWIATAIVCVALQGCDREDPGAKHRAPTTDAPVPHINVENAAPLHNAEGYPNEARARPALRPAGELPPLGDRTARGKLIAAPGRAITGDARLEEVADAVRVTIEVANAPPGTRRVTLEDASQCKGIAAVPEPTEEEVERGIGTIAIGERGTGKSTLHLPTRNLRPDDPNSLLGKALVLHAAERVAGAAPVRDKPVACITIQAT